MMVWLARPSSPQCMVLWVARGGGGGGHMEVLLIRASVCLIAVLVVYR